MTKSVKKQYIYLLSLAFKALLDSVKELVPESKERSDILLKLEELEKKSAILIDRQETDT